MINKSVICKMKNIISKIRTDMADVYVGTQTRKLPILVWSSAIPVLVPVLVQAAPYSIIH